VQPFHDRVINRVGFDKPTTSALVEHFQRAASVNPITECGRTAIEKVSMFSPGSWRFAAGRDPIGPIPQMQQT
jgi:hypothetical protein